MRFDEHTPGHYIKPQKQVDLSGAAPDCDGYDDTYIMPEEGAEKTESLCSIGLQLEVHLRFCVSAEMWGIYKISEECIDDEDFGYIAKLSPKLVDAWCKDVSEYLDANFSQPEGWDFLCELKLGNFSEEDQEE